MVEALAYLLGNQRGKARMRRDATARDQRSTWRMLFLSTGELGLAARLAEGGRRMMAGQPVRVIEIPADAGAGLGIFEHLNGFAGGCGAGRAPAPRRRPPVRPCRRGHSSSG